MSHHQTLNSNSHQPPAWRGWAVFIAAVAGTFLLGLLAASILQRREEARPQRPLEPIAALETDSSKWAVNWPREYDRYKLMLDSTTKTSQRRPPT
jgi:nitrite reductase (cytochrome c-552)